MRALSDRDVIEIWERGRGRHPIDRALAVLASALPHLPLEHLAALSIGERDARLLDAYAQLFGRRFDAAASCVRCHESLEFSFQVDDVRAAPGAPAQASCRLRLGAVELEYRLPNSLDLAAIVSRTPRPANLAAARASLVERCVLSVTDGEQVIAATDLLAPHVDALAAHMQASDPQADVTLEATCPACGHAWPLCFDVATFLWARVALRARQLLREVHVLARAYGWCEADVLDLTDERRREYLELVT